MVSMTLFWFIAAVLFLLIEMGHPGLFFFLSFSCGAVIALGSSYFLDSVVHQGSLFLGGSIMAFIVLKLWLRSRLAMPASHYKTNVDALVGKKCVVIEPITPFQAGRIKVSGDVWLAKPLQAKTFAVGDQVEIVKVVGSHIVVKESVGAHGATSV